MKSIRRNCFETNSSSMHSIAIVKGAKPYADIEKLNYCSNNDGFLDLFYLGDDDDMHFERYPFRILRSEDDKLRYILGYYYSCDGEGTEHKKKIEEIHNLVKQKYPEIKNIKDWKDSYDWEGHPCKEYPSTAYSNDTGEDVFAFIKRKKLTMEDVIFNPNIVIFVDGDEYQQTFKLFDSGIISEDSIEDISSGINYWMRRKFTFDIGMIDWIYHDGSNYKDYYLKKILDCKNVEKASIQIDFDRFYNNAGKEHTIAELYEMAAPYVHKIFDTKAIITVNNRVDETLYKKYILDTYTNREEGNGDK